MKNVYGETWIKEQAAYRSKNCNYWQNAFITDPRSTDFAGT